MSAAFDFSVDPSVLAALPEFRVALLHVKIPDQWSAPLPAVDEDAGIPALHGIDAGNITTHAVISGWRNAYRQQGLKPGDWRSSVEALLRRLLKSQDIRTEIPFVGTYNYVSAMTLTPMGAYDIDRFDIPTLCLRKIQPTDHFMGLGEKQIEPASHPDALVYASGSAIACFGVNYRDAERTAVRPDSRNLLVVFDCAEALHRPLQDRAVELLARLLTASGAQCGTPAYFGAGIEPAGSVALDADISNLNQPVKGVSYD